MPKNNEKKDWCESEEDYYEYDDYEEEIQNNDEFYNEFLNSTEGDKEQTENKSKKRSSSGSPHSRGFQGISLMNHNKNYKK